MWTNAVATLLQRSNALRRPALTLIYGAPLLRLSLFAGHINTSSQSDTSDRKNINCDDSQSIKVEVASNCSPKKSHRVRDSNATFLRCNCGEDAFFVTETSHSVTFGVADGVGGWTSHGVDPSKFAWVLMNHCKDVADAEVMKVSPLQVLTKGYDQLKVEKKVEAGSSTACVLVVDKEKKSLNVANLGDSGFYLIRDGQVVAKSTEQQHFFNAPFQLAQVPTKLRDTSFDDVPSQADIYSVDVHVGDIILVATDGLFDNVFQDRILEVIEAANGDLKSAASSLVSLGLSKGHDQNYQNVTPFVRNGEKHGMNYYGGKPDDVTVILARVSAHTVADAA